MNGLKKQITLFTEKPTGNIWVFCILYRKSFTVLSTVKLTLDILSILLKASVKHCTYIIWAYFEIIIIMRWCICVPPSPYLQCWTQQAKRSSVQWGSSIWGQETASLSSSLWQTRPALNTLTDFINSYYGSKTGKERWHAVWTKTHSWSFFCMWENV